MPPFGLGFNFNKSDESTLEKKILFYHRLAEIFKFSYSKRPYLGDPDKVAPQNKTEFENVSVTQQSHIE